jgi:NADP-dependent 3-hydroxy acid dehydrogenase YdfG
MELQGTVAIVTGASRGIGLAVANALLQRGALVAGWSRTTAPTQHPHYLHCPTDIRNLESVRAAYGATLQAFGTPLILVNNAGLGHEAPLLSTAPEQWHEMFDTNVHGLYYSTREVLGKMKEQGRGHIVNISSVAGTTGIPGMTAYCATKYAVRGFSQALLKEVRPLGVKVTCVFPGSVNTHFFDSINSVQASDQMMHPDHVAATIVHCLESPDNYEVAEVEVRPMRLKG